MKAVFTIILCCPFLAFSQFSEKLSFQFEYGKQSNSQEAINNIILDTNLMSLGTQNEPRFRGFRDMDTYGINLKLRPSKNWDVGIVGRWQFEQISHFGNTPIDFEGDKFNFLEIAVNRVEYTQLGISGNLYLNSLLGKGNRLEYGVCSEISYLKTNYQYYSRIIESTQQAPINGQQTKYRSSANGVVARIGVHASYGIVIGRSKVSIGIGTGFQFGMSQNLSNSGGESFINIVEQQASVNANGGYGSVFLKLSR